MTQLSLLLSFLLLLSACSTHKSKKSISPIKTKTISQHALVELDHQHFKIGYDPKLRLAHYVAYQLTAEKLSGPKFKRKNKFKPDPLLLKQGLPFVESKEYARSGFDRGHLAPAADFSWSEEASDRTFVMSNMAPQKPELNRKAWKKLEDQVRRWACGEKKVTIITGPLLEESQQKLSSGLLVPGSFYKVIIDETPPKKVLSFIYYQEDSGDVIKERMVTLNQLQAKARLITAMVPAELRSSRIPASLKEWKEADCSRR